MKEEKKMIIIACIDDRKGLMFNGRRVSKDRMVIEDILKEADKSSLWMNAYSAKMMKEYAPDRPVLCDENFLKLANRGEYCFIENNALSGYINEIEQIILYHWNRKYPADMYFDIDLSAPVWNKKSSSDFVGNSHDKITKEVYKNETIS